MRRTLSPINNPVPEDATVPALNVEISQIVSLSTRGRIELQTAVAGASNNTRHVIATCAGPPAAVAAFLRQMAEEIEHPLYVITTDGEHPQVRGPFYDTANLPSGPPGE